MAGKGINIKVKREAIIKALHDRLTEMVHIQEEYEREGIKWSFISFPGKTRILDLTCNTS